MKNIIAQIKTFYNKVGRIVDMDKIFVGLLVIFVSMASFSLGRLSKIFDERPEFNFRDVLVQEEKIPLSSSLEKRGIVQTNVSNIVATKSGQKYYFIWCKGVENLKEKNKVYFATEDDAKRAGKTLANNCK